MVVVNRNFYWEFFAAKLLFRRLASLRHFVASTKETNMIESKIGDAEHYVQVSLIFVSLPHICAVKQHPKLNFFSARGHTMAIGIA